MSCCLVDFSGFSEVLGKTRNPKWRIQDGRHFKNLDVFPTSLLRFPLRISKVYLWKYYPFFKSHCDSFYTGYVFGIGRGTTSHNLVERFTRDHETLGFTSTLRGVFS